MSKFKVGDTVRCIDDDDDDDNMNGKNAKGHLTEGETYILTSVIGSFVALKNVPADMYFLDSQFTLVSGAVDTESRDTVNRPQHYTNGAIECIDAIESATQGLEGMDAVCTSQVLKYTWRWKHKNGAEDLKKARWYLDRLISKLENDTNK